MGTSLGAYELNHASSFPSLCIEEYLKTVLELSAMHVD